MYHSGIASLGRVKSSDIHKTQLFRYVSNGKHKKISSVITSQNLYVDDCNSRGQTPLFVACLMGHTKCVSVLLFLGANPNRRCDDGSTPTHAAAFSCNSGILTEVVKHGGDLRLHDNRNLVPRDWAIEAGKKRNAKILQVIDQYYVDVMANLYIQPSMTNPGPSLSRMLSKVTSESTSEIKMKMFNNKQLEINSQGYGDYVAVKYIAEQHFKEDNQVEVGHAALIPIIQSDQLTTTENSLQQEAPPMFFMSHGKWGQQAVTLKFCKEQRKHRSIQSACASDLLVHELKINRMLRHPSVLLLMGTCFEMGQTSTSTTTAGLQLHCFVYENISLGSLHNLLHLKKYFLSEANKLLLLTQIGNAISYVHQLGFIHCCISSFAIYLCSDQQAKLSNFYYTLHRKDLAPIENKMSSIFNRWVAPELLVNKKPCVETDIYSFCVVVCETLSGILPWKGFDAESVRHQVVSRGHMLLVPPVVPKPLHKVLYKGLSVSRSKRTTKLQEIEAVLKSLLNLQSDFPQKDGNSCEFMTSTFQASSQYKKGQMVDNADGDLGIDQPDSCAFQVKTMQQSIEGPTFFQKRCKFPEHSEIYKKNTENTEVENIHQLSTQLPDCENLRPTFSLSVSCPQRMANFSEVCSDVQGRWSHSGAQQNNSSNRDDSVSVIHSDLLDTDSLKSSMVSMSEEYLYNDTDVNQNPSISSAKQGFVESIISESVGVLTTEDFDEILNCRENCVQPKDNKPVCGENVKQIENQKTFANNPSNPHSDMIDCKKTSGDSLYQMFYEERSSHSFTDSYIDINHHAPIPVGAFSNTPLKNSSGQMNLKETKSVCQEKVLRQETESEKSLPACPPFINSKIKENGTKSCHRYSHLRQIKPCNNKVRTNEPKDAAELSETTGKRCSVDVGISHMTVTSPLHFSVQKVQKSLEEFTKLFKDEAQVDGKNVLEIEHSLSCVDKDNRCDKNYNNETENFVEEVLNAAGLSEVDITTANCLKETKPKPKNSKATCNKVSGGPPPIVGQQTTSELEAVKKIKVPKQNMMPLPNEVEHISQIAGAQSIPAQLFGAPQPSADNATLLEQSISNKGKNEDKANETKTKRFSITSEDLIDIFTDFADRKGFVQVEENCHQDELGCVDVTNPCSLISDNMNGVENYNQCTAVSKVTTMNQASQTSPNHAKMCKLEKMLAEHPPSIKEFLCRTGDWSLIVVPPNEVQTTNKQNILDSPNNSNFKEDCTRAPIHKEIQLKNATPSKWTFRQKLSMFETNTADKIIETKARLQKNLTAKFEAEAKNEIPLTLEENITSPLYLTALDKELSNSYLNDTPIHQTGTLIPTLRENGVKTSTPVTSEDLNITSKQIILEEENDNYKNIKQFNTAIDCRKKNVQTTKQQDETSPVLKTSVTRRSNSLPNISVLLNASAFKRCTHKNSITTNSQFNAHHDQYRNSTDTSSEEGSNSVISEDQELNFGKLSRHTSEAVLKKMKQLQDLNSLNKSVKAGGCSMPCDDSVEVDPNDFKCETNVWSE